MMWTEIRIHRNSINEWMVYTTMISKTTGKLVECLQGVYATRKRLNKCVSKCLNMLITKEDSNEEVTHGEENYAGNSEKLY